jgi:hypothetical protein
MSEARIAPLEPNGSSQLEFCMLKFLAAAALIGAALLADGTQAQAGHFRHRCKKCHTAPTCQTASPCGAVAAPAPMVMPRTR